MVTGLQISSCHFGGIFVLLLGSDTLAYIIVKLVDKDERHVLYGSQRIVVSFCTTHQFYAIPSPFCA